MPKGTKLEEELKQEGNTILIPVENLPVISENVAKKTVKRAMSEKQLENAKKLGELSKARWEKLREEKARLKLEEEEKKKADEKALIEAGTHVRVRVKENVPRRKAHEKVKPLKPLPLRRETYQADSSDDETETETETESEVEEKPRRVRQSVKKNLRVLERVDEALSRAPMNPYVAMLQGRWM